MQTSADAGSAALIYGVDMVESGPPTEAIHAELDRVRSEFHDLVTHATASDLRRKSAGTDWSNRELLFHMLFGYLVTRSLLVLVTLISRAPRAAQRGFASVLDMTTPAFHRINFWGSRAGGAMISPRRADAWLARVIASLHRRLDAETDSSLRRTMRFPVRWDPYFAERMSRADVYHYATLHFDYHRRQLTMDHTADDR
jgi:hypothetical protein